MPRLDGQQHPFLRFGQHHLIRRHLVLTARHFSDINVDAQFTSFRHLHCCARNPRRSAVLHSDNARQLNGFKTRFDENFFEEGITDLDG